MSESDRGAQSLTSKILSNWRGKCARVRYSMILVNSFHQEFIKCVYRALAPIEPRHQTLVTWAEPYGSHYLLEIAGTPN